MSRSDKLAAALLADRERTGTAHNIIACRVCGHTFVYRGRRGELNGNFCSLRCQSWYDDGKPEIDPDSKTTALKTPLAAVRVIVGPPDLEIGSSYYERIFPKLTPMRMGPKGWFIRCYNCEREFESLGLRCCSAECERRCRERDSNLATMAEVGMTTKPKRQCVACGGRIPTWRNGRKVSSATRFCSPKCRAKGHRAKTLAA